MEHFAEEGCGEGGERATLKNPRLEKLKRYVEKESFSKNEDDTSVFYKWLHKHSLELKLLLNKDTNFENRHEKEICFNLKKLLSASIYKIDNVDECTYSRKLSDIPKKKSSEPSKKGKIIRKSIDSTPKKLGKTSSKSDEIPSTIFGDDFGTAEDLNSIKEQEQIEYQIARSMETYAEEDKKNAMEEDHKFALSLEEEEDRKFAIALEQHELFDDND